MFVFPTHSLGACLEPKDRSSHENVCYDCVIAAEHHEKAAYHTCRGIFLTWNVRSCKQERNWLVTQGKLVLLFLLLFVAMFFH